MAFNEKKVPMNNLWLCGVEKRTLNIMKH